MFLSIVKYFQGFLLVRLSGYSPERFLNLCSNHNILIWNLKSRGEYYEFYISVAAFRRLKPLLKKTKTHLTILKRVGFPFFLYRYRKRKIFFLGIAGCIAFLLYLTTFIWLIDINGNSSITDETILSFLEERQSAFGTKKNSIDCEKLEEELRSQFADVIWASVRLNGTKMTVDIQENLLESKNHMEAKEAMEGAYNIVAEKDAVITSIITRKGTPGVKAGDEVKEGDLLVSSRLDIYNDSQEIIDYVYTCSDADIYGRTTYTYEDSFPMEFTQKVKTGEVSHGYEILLCSYKIPIPPLHKIEEPYMVYRENHQLAIAKDYYIPVTLRKITYADCVYEKVTLTKDQAKQQAKENISQFLKKMEEKGIQIVDKNVMIEFEENRCQVKGSITAQEKIGKYEPAEIEKIDTGEETKEYESD